MINDDCIPLEESDLMMDEQSGDPCESWDNIIIIEGYNKMK